MAQPKERSDERDIALPDLVMTVSSSARPLSALGAICAGGEG